MKCIYVASNQMSTPDVDFRTGTKHASTDLSWTSSKRSTLYVCTGLLLSSLETHLNLLLVNAGHLECAHWSLKKKKKKEVPEQLKEGGGAGASPFCTLHRGSNRLKAG